MSTSLELPDLVAEPVAPTAVVIVFPPVDWTPTGIDDIQPSYTIDETVVEWSEYEDRGFAEGFNGAELREPKGWWAMVPKQATASA